jgi:transposase
MDTSTGVERKQTSSRGSKRRMRTLAEKRQIVEEALRGEESVAIIARRHEVNANLLFVWKRQYERGLLEPSGTALVPVKVRKQRVSSARGAGNPDDECVEIDLGAGKCVRVRGQLAVLMLERLLSGLCSR